MNVPAALTPAARTDYIPSPLVPSVMAVPGPDPGISPGHLLRNDTCNHSVVSRQLLVSRLFYIASIRLTWAATTRQPSGILTQVCIWRPIFPGTLSRSNKVEAVAKSCPYVVITVREIRRASPTGERADRNAAIASLPYKFSPIP